MSSESDRRSSLRVFSWLARRLPADLATTTLIVVVAVLAVFLPKVNQTPLRFVVSVPFLLFVPGYVFVAALFPKTAAIAGSDGGAGEGEDKGNDDYVTAIDQRPALQRVIREGYVDSVERIVLSVGMSIVIVILLGLGLSFTPWGIRRLPLVVSIAGFTLFSTLFAVRRRRAVPAEMRFSVPYRRWGGLLRDELLKPKSRTDFALNSLIVVVALIAIMSVALAVAFPQPSTGFTDFYVLSENKSGNLSATDYPTTLTTAESTSFYLGISNHEHRDAEYTVVVKLQRVSNNTTHVLEQEELRRLSVTVSRNKTWRHQLNLSPTLTGQHLRLAFLLYEGEPPARPTMGNAYRELHLWVNVTAPEERNR